MAYRSGRVANRLALESSPYLLQHAGNPVDWYPWGEEAFARARADDRPILLSVGYATCHWCHVMERESFEDPVIAQQLADAFVAIKVDREELPDVDQVYMRALQSLTGRGGWPMNVFLTPQLAPFFAGTYFPPTPRPGATSFPEVLKAIADAWRDRRGGVEQQARGLLVRLASVAAGSVPMPGPAPGDGLHRRAMAQIAAAFDPVGGGFGSAPKFPQAPLLQYLLTLAATGDAEAGRMLGGTLTAMASGGVYDQVGGGFARYSTDARWQVPHFEKMLTDNAQLARVYAGAYRLSGDERLRVVAEETLGYLLREMHPAASAAAFGSAQDADADGVEGRFHVWTRGEFAAVLDDDADAAAMLYGVTAEGNWQAHEPPGRNVLERREPEAARGASGLDAAGFAAWERGVRERLYAARARRTPPLIDDKVLADGNGMALRALSEAARLLGRDDFLQAARDLAVFLLATLAGEDRVHHAWRDGRLRPEGYLADHAQLGLGLVELHAATGEPEWLAAATRIADVMLIRFHSADDGFHDSESSRLPIRARELHDGAVPSGTAAACELLLRLAGAAGRNDWHDLAEATLRSHRGPMESTPMATPALLLAALLAEHGADLAVPFGDGSEALWTRARSAHVPLLTLVGGSSGSLPLLEGRIAGEAYLCRHGRCELPARSTAALDERLAGVRSPPIR